MYSVVILTLNEEKALPACMASLKGVDDVVVLDSGSSDGTVSIAAANGARLFSRAFDDFAGQRNYAGRHIAFRHPWVFHLDADERMTPELDAECRSAASRTDLEGFRVAPKMVFEGRWIPHCTDYPAYQARFVRRQAFEFIQVGHGQREAPHMRMENLRSAYVHDLSVYGREAWLLKHRAYARNEARAVVESTTRTSLSALFSGDKLVRRRAIKSLSFALPLRPLFRFAYQYGLRGGFLDGKQGLRYCLMLARYEGFIAEELAKFRRAT